MSEASVHVGKVLYDSHRNWLLLQIFKYIYFIFVFVEGSCHEHEYYVLCVFEFLYCISKLRRHRNTVQNGSKNSLSLNLWYMCEYDIYTYNLLQVFICHINPYPYTTKVISCMWCACHLHSVHVCIIHTDRWSLI